MPMLSTQLSGAFSWPKNTFLSKNTVWKVGKYFLTTCSITEARSAVGTLFCIPLSFSVSGQSVPSSFLEAWWQTNLQIPESTTLQAQDGETSGCQPGQNPGLCPSLQRTWPSAARIPHPQKMNIWTQAPCRCHHCFWQETESLLRGIVDTQHWWKGISDTGLRTNQISLSPAQVYVLPAAAASPHSSTIWNLPCIWYKGVKCLQIKSCL